MGESLKQDLLQWLLQRGIDNFTTNNNDSDDGAETDSASPDESLAENIHLFTTGFDRNISVLQYRVNELREITDSVEKVHRNTTIGSLSGGVFGAAGGIMTIVGLILTRFTLGGSLGLTGLGITVAAAAGVTGAVSTITDLIKQKMSRKKIKFILKSIENKLNPLLKSLKEIELSPTEIELSLMEIPRSQPTDPSIRNAQIGFGLGRGIGYAVETIRLTNTVEIGIVVSRTVTAATAVTGLIASLLIILDLFFIAKYTKELKEIDKRNKDGSERSNTVKFIHAMKETIKNLNDTLDKLREARKQFTVNP